MKYLVWGKEFLKKETPEEDFVQFFKVNILLYYTLHSLVKASVDSLRVRYVSVVGRVLELSDVSVREKTALWEATASGQRAIALCLLTRTDLPGKLLL